MGKHTRKPQGADEPERSTLGELIHAAVRRAIEAAVEEELAGALGADRYEREVARRGYRNGTKERTLTGPTGPVPLTLPRATLTTSAGRKEWASTLVPRYQRRLPEVNAAVLATYLAGGNTRRLRGALGPLLHGAPLSRSAVSRIVATLKGSLDAWLTQPLAEREVVYAYLDALMVRVRSAGQVVSAPVLAVVGGPHRWPEGPADPGTVQRGRVLRGVEGLPGRARGPRAQGAAARHHRRPPGVAARRRRGLAPGGGAAVLCPQAAQHGAQGAQARAGGGAGGLPRDCLRSQRRGGADGLDDVRADLGEALAWRRQEPARRGRGAADVLQLPQNAVEDPAHHQRDRAPQRRVPAPGEDAGRLADRGQRPHPALRSRRHRADHAPQARWLQAAGGGHPPADAAGRVKIRSMRLEAEGRRGSRIALDDATHIWVSPETGMYDRPARLATLPPGQDPAACASAFSTSSGTPPCSYSSGQ